MARCERPAVCQRDWVATIGMALPIAVCAVPAVAFPVFPRLCPHGLTERPIGAGKLSTCIAPHRGATGAQRESVRNRAIRQASR